jgi:hypothetical protein
LNEAVMRLRARGAAKLQDLYADVDEAIRKVTSGKDFVTPPAVRLLSEITDFRLFVALTPDDLLARSTHSPANEIIHAPKLPTSEGRDLPPDWSQRSGEAHLL